MNHNASSGTSLVVSLFRMWALTLRHVRQTYGDLARFVNFFFWPILDMTLWGFSTQWIQKNYVHDVRLQISMLVTIIAWQVIRRATMDLSFHLLEDMADRNIANIFASPLSLVEWVGGITILSLLNALTTLLACFVSVKVLYGFNMFAIFGVYQCIFLFPVFISGLAFGFLSGAPLWLWGRRLQGAIFVIVWIFAPFSGAYYPIAALPQSMQYVAQVLPFNYAMQGMRSIVLQELVPWRDWFVSMGLAIFYYGLLFSFFALLFVRSKNRGLERLAD